MLSLLFLSCSCNHKIALNDVSKGNLRFFKDLKLIDSLKLELGDIDEDWNSVINACIENLDKNILFIGEGYCFEYNSGYSETIITDSGKSIFINNPLNTVIYSRAPVSDKFDEFRFFEVFCSDFNNINYGGDIKGVSLRKLSDNEVIRILDVRKKWFGRLFPSKEEIEYVFFEKEGNSLFVYDYLFECPPYFNDFPDD